MYKNGKYKYKSKKAYQKKLKSVFIVFLFCAFMLVYLKPQMSLVLFWFTLFVDVSMQLHLVFRYLHSNDKISYVFNEY